MNKAAEQLRTNRNMGTCPPPPPYLPSLTFYEGPTVTQFNIIFSARSILVNDTKYGNCNVGQPQFG